MGFLLPVAFTLLGLIAILIIFYLFKKKFERKIVSSTYLWDQLMKEWETNRWNKKLNQNLLFFLQLLIMLTLIFALARPYLNGENTITAEQVVIILDTSASMAVEEQDLTRFDLAKQAAKELVNKLNQNQMVTIVNEKTSPELLLTNESNHRKTVQVIDDLQLSYEENNITDSLQLADSLIHEDQAEIHLFSDHVKKEIVKEIPINHNLVVHNIGKTKQNISIRSFGVKHSGDAVNGVITLYNEGNQKEKVEIQIKSEANTLQQIEKTLEPQKLTIMKVENLPVESVYEVITNAKDAYTLDNQSYAFLANNESPTIYTAGEVNPFVQKAIQSFSSEMISIKGKTGEQLDFPKQTTKGISILANIPAENWPKGAKLIFSPTSGGPFEIDGKKDLEFVLNGKDDPLLRYVDIEDLYLAKSYSISNLKDLEPIVMSGDKVIVAKGIYNGDPLVLFAFDIKDSDWPLHPSFPILLNNALSYLQPQNTYLGRFLPGERIDVSFSPTTKDGYIEGPDGKRLQDVKTNDMLQMPVVPGLYKLNEKTDEGLESRYFAVEIMDAEKLTLHEKSFSLKANESKYMPKVITNNEIWYLLAFVSLILLFIEWEVYRRGIRGR